MAAEKGNEWWRLRLTSGAKPYYEEVELLVSDFNKYIEHADDKVMTRGDWVGKDATPVNRKFNVPYSLAGFCVFIGASRNWWNEFRKTCVNKSNKGDQKAKDFLEVLARIDDIITTQQFEGAVVGLFKENIISRIQGLADKQEVDEKSTKKATIVMNIVRPKDRKDIKK